MLCRCLLHSVVTALVRQVEYEEAFNLALRD